MERILCNLTGFKAGNTGGAEVFLRCLLPELERLDDLKIVYFGSAKTNEWLSLYMDNVNFKQVQCRFGVLGRLWSNFSICLFAEKGDIVWSPLNIGIMCHPKRTQVITVHDDIPLHYIKNRKKYNLNFITVFKFWLKWNITVFSVNRSNALVTVSRSCVQVLSNVFNSDVTLVGATNALDKKKVFTTHSETVPNKISNSVLVVGSGNLPHKGLNTVFKVAALNPQLKFTIVGKTPELLKYSKNISFTGWVSDEELLTLYAQNSVLFFPSNCEGFGLPILEALYNGTKVVATDNPVMREVGGRFSYYFLPNDVKSASNMLRKTFCDEDHVNKLWHEEAKKHVLSFSWKKTAMIYKSTFESVCAE